MEKKLNLGCGNKILEGYVNLDIVKKPGVDVVHDLEEFPYPFKDNEFDFIWVDNVLEHLDDTVGVMKEIHRITKYGGIVKIVVPYFSHPSAWSDPTHKKAFNEDTLIIFSNEILPFSKLHPDMMLLVSKKYLFRRFKYKYHLTHIGRLVKPFVRILKPFCNVLVIALEVEYEK